MSEQQTASACPHPDAVGKRWGDPISEERQAKLQSIVDRWEAETGHGERKGPFAPARKAHVSLEAVRLAGGRHAGVHLTGSDVSWLAERSGRSYDGYGVPNLHLEGADLGGAQLQDADLRGASFDKASILNNAVLTGVVLDQVTFDNTNLSVVDWRNVLILGDELRARMAKDENGERKSRADRVLEYQGAARAYRRLAVALQANGLSEEVSGYLYRAQIMQRRLAYRERRLGAYFFSVLLAVLAGYGYRLWRIVAVYLSVDAAFALAYLAVRYFAGTVIDWTQVADAMQISLNAIHGRVFFAQLALDSAQAWIATVESVVGIVIEGVFVAMLIQRFFGR
jgi:hypothetical protein